MTLQRREFTREHKAAMLRRARDDKGIIRCEGCSRDLTGKRFEFDHTLAEGLVLDKSKKLTANDGKLLGTECCHRGPDGKTAQDVAAIAEAKRRETKLNGIHTRAKARIPGPPRRTPKNAASAPLQKWFGPALEKRT